nr:MAG TPA: hypothetical protein [Caudoviricetes sp.]
MLQFQYTIFLILLTSLMYLDHILFIYKIFFSVSNVAISIYYFPNIINLINVLSISS